MNLSAVTCLMWDNGLFVGMAETLSESFGKVYYYSPWEGPFPTDKEVAVGVGMGKVERTDDPSAIIRAHQDDDSFMVFFPDTYQGDTQADLRSRGIRVWGTGAGEQLENDRLLAKRQLFRLGIPVADYDPRFTLQPEGTEPGPMVVTGVDALRRALEGRSDVFVKARYGRMRGNFETKHVNSLVQVETWLRKVALELGGREKGTEFLIENAIGPAVEIGYDGYCVRGVFPDRSCVGIEIKSQAYIGRMVDDDNLPYQIKELHQALTPYLTSVDYANFFALETRITEDGTPYAIDPCCRAGRPPSEMLQSLYTNLADIVWNGANGVCVSPIPAGQWGAEVMLYCEEAAKYECALEIPEAISPHVKLSNEYRMKGEKGVRRVLPGLTGIGAVTAIGETMKEAIDLCKERAEALTTCGDGVELFPDALDKAQGEWSKLKKHDVDL